MRIDIIEETIIDILYARSKFFLWTQRHRTPTDRWFSVRDIADHFGETPPIPALLVALRRLSGCGEVEFNDGLIRHC